MQLHVVSFEGPDPYSRAGGLATRVEGLLETLVDLGFETHLWFLGDPELPSNESHGKLHLHRWAQWLSRGCPGGVYDGEDAKEAEMSASLPPYLVGEVLVPYLAEGGSAVVLAEEWQTAGTVLQLHRLLDIAEVRERVSLVWNANNTFGFDRIDWERLREAAMITTVSRYMKHRMRDVGVDPLVVPNGLTDEAFVPPARAAVNELRGRTRGRTLVTKMARWDPDKRWLATVDIVGAMKQQGWDPLLVARGGSEPHGDEILRRARAQGLSVVERRASRPGPEGLLEAIDANGSADVIDLRSHVDPDARRVLFRASDAVLANSGHEPFGLVGLETMAAGGLACTGCSGEDYAVPGHNAVVLETEDPREFLGLFGRLRRHPDEARALRRNGQSTARRYTWREIVQRVFLPRLDVGAVTG